MALNSWQLLSLAVTAPFFYGIGMTMCPFKEPTFPLLGISTGEVKLCVQTLVSVCPILLVQLQAIWISTSGLTKKGGEKSTRMWTGLKHNAAGEMTQWIQCLPPKSEDLSSNPGTHMREGETHFWKPSSDLEHAWRHTHTAQCNLKS